jgi:hydroxypyruvate isomerase
MSRFAANISTLFTAHPFLERFALAARAGFRAVEMQFPYEHKPAELAAAVSRAGVEVVLINMPAGDFAGGERGIACLPDRVDEFHRAMRQAADYAEALGCPRVNCLAGNVPEGAAREACWDVLVENLRHAADSLAMRNIRLLVEPLNGVDNPRFIIGNTAAAADLLTVAGNPNLALQYDVYHARAAGEDVLAGLARHIGIIGHIQISDYPGRGEPGTGTLDFAGLFRALEHLPYDGWVGCEYFAAEPGDFGWMKALQLRP